jgi:eukaryotic-like serine/threonine-protein kinase
MTGLHCLPVETIFEFSVGRLTGEEIERVESHAAQCEECRALLARALATGTGAGSLKLGTVPEGARAKAIGIDTVRRGALIGRYTVLGLVGRGGMGQVYAAYDPDLDRKVALKLLLTDGASRAAEAQARLIREARALAKVSHPNVVKVHDAGTFEGRVFIGMEFIDGPTLQEWLESPRSHVDILNVFVSAARALAAAHDEGLVHRDFKPGNTMLARDGTVRVMDFGLARVMEEPGDDGGVAKNESSARSPALTRTGELLGTPLFMAPEQFSGAPTDPRTDQFAFCVALYRALYEVAPFSGDTFAELSQSVRTGLLSSPPPRTSVSPRLRRIVVRGLSIDPASRWPSMHALADALKPTPRGGRRRLGAVAAALLLIGISVLVGVRGAVHPPPLCLGGPARLANVWEDSGTGPSPRRTAIARAFTATGARDALDVWDRVSASLDRYRAAWLAMYRDTCEAANVRHEQTTTMLDERMTCLEDRRRAFAALSDVFATADREVVSRAVSATNALPPVNRCEDLKALETLLEPPSDPATRKRVEDIRGSASVAKALDDTGKHQEAARRYRSEIAEARLLGYRPLIAELLGALGQTLRSGSFTNEVPSLEEEALWTALAVGRDDVAAEAAVALVGDFGDYLAKPDEARAWAKAADGLLQRAGEGHDILHAWLYANEAQLATAERNSQLALDLVQRSLAIKRRVLPPDHPDVAEGLSNEAEYLARLGKTEEALRVNGSARDIFVRAYGPTSTEAAYSLNNRGEYLITLGRPVEAVQCLKQSLTSWEGQVGPTHPFLGYPLTALGRAFLALGRPQEALEPLERSLRLREADEPDVLLVAETRFALARALWDTSPKHERALSMAREARAAYERASDTRL